MIAVGGDECQPRGRATDRGALLEPSCKEDSEGSDRPGGCDGGTPAGAENRRFSDGSLPYRPHVTMERHNSGAPGLDRAERMGLTGGAEVTGGVIPGVNWALRPAYPSGAAIRV